VTLSDLNKPLNEHLRMEELRLDALATNTLIHYGLAKGPVVPVPNPEFERRHISTIPEPSFSIQDESQPRKRKSDLQAQDDRPHKRQQPTVLDSPVHLPCPMEGNLRKDIMPSSSHASNNLKVSATPCHFPLPCPNWDSQNYSCAYDSVFVILMSAFFHSGTRFQMTFASHSPGASMLTNLFNEV
ncbi:hypothetical protein M407DRAFT_53180, partial [Tulasnella calospora MUT 4182]